ncbi:MAG: MBL fold metallo-hydrolase [Gemmatimonadales bacterium]
MLVRRCYDDRLAQASYLIGCQETREAIMVDPGRDIAVSLDAARREGVRITRITETHIHADFLSGSRELAQATKAEILLSAEGGPDWQYRYPATALHDGDVINVGSVKITVCHTPGHTPEHLSFLVTDTPQSPDPVALISGDFLFVGDVGRPDLLETAAGVAASKEPSARQLFHSLHRLAALPDYLQIWPGHGAGSACGKALGALPSSTLGYERRTNRAFRVADEAEFVATVLEGQPPAPPYFARMKRLNRDGPPILGSRPELPELGPAKFAGAIEAGIVLDVRPRTAFAKGHIDRTLNIPLNRSFTKWAGWLIPDDRDVFLVAPDAATAADARLALSSIGLDRVVAWFGPAVVGAVDAGAARASRTGRMAEAPRMQQEGTLVIDVRDQHEWDDGHLEGAEHHPLGTLSAAVDSVDRERTVAVHCQGGGRSAIAASLLEQIGFRNVIDLTDGWRGVTRR